MMGWIVNHVALSEKDSTDLLVRVCDKLGGRADVGARKSDDCTIALVDDFIYRGRK